MRNPIASFCVYWAEMLIAYTYFSGILKPRFSLKKCLVIGLLLFSMGSVINLVSGNNTNLNLCSSFVIAVLFALCCFRGTAIQSVFYAVMLIVVNCALEAGILSLSAYITGNDFLDYNNNVLLLLFEAISSKGIYFLVVLVFIRIINPSGSASKVPLIFLVYPVASTFCLFVFWRICAQPECSQQIQLLAAIAAGCLFVASVLLFISYSQQAEKDREAITVKSELARLQMEQSYYQILDQQNQQLLVYAHDTKKHLSAIQALSNEPQINSYVAELSQQLAAYTRNCHSGNKLLDVMINKYVTECEMQGIQFEYDVKVCNLSQLDDIDLVAILVNLLDNAVAAAATSETKAIMLNTVRRNAYSVIVISNSCDMPPKQTGNHLISTKADAGLHGFGLKSVAKTLKKYQGDFEWEYDASKKLFTITVMTAEKNRDLAKI